jgi:hypothetical protein
MTLLLNKGVIAQTGTEPEFADSLDVNMHLLKRYLSHGDNWHFTDPLTESRLQGLIHFIENEPVDTIINHFNRMKEHDNITFLSRKPEYVNDSLSIPGFISYRQLIRHYALIDEEVANEFAGKPMLAPEEMINDSVSRLPLIPEGNGMQLFTDKIFQMPDSFKVLDAIPEEKVKSQNDFKRILFLDSIRSLYVEQKRKLYNDSLVKVTRENVNLAFKNRLMTERGNLLKSQKHDVIRRSNNQVLKVYNDHVMQMVNDSLKQAVGWLNGFANLIDNTTINLVNLTNTPSSLVLSNAGRFFTRIWLKNRQNDSLAVLAQNIDNRSMQLVIEDGVLFSRFKQQAVKDFDFNTLNHPSTLDNISRRYQAYTPWMIGGDGTMGFNQTYLSNWKKGGKSALSILVALKGFANFSSDKLKWENSAEIRNGWIKPGDDAIQKNDDKFEITSRLGVSAFQKWYYSAEADFETQFFYGYKYPDRTKPISGYLAPGRFLFKLGLDYKPTKNFSLFISPLTSKTVFVRDTLKVEKANFGIKPGRTAYWEPGINMDIKFKKEIVTGITFDTKYRMFINYLAPFKTVDLEWENNLSVQVTDYIGFKVLVHSIYDSKILFDKLDKNGDPVLDINGQKIREPKLQFREFITVGFTYKINKRIIRAREVN